MGSPGPLLRAARRCIAGVLLASIGLFQSGPASAFATYAHGYITNVTFAGDYIMVMMDVALPDNCVGTPHGWMIIPPANTPMTAFVLGLWMRGDAASTQLTVYTSGLVNGYCQINQIDPPN